LSFFRFMQTQRLKNALGGFYRFYTFIRSLGLATVKEEQERSKLSIFNLLCFLQLITGTLIPLIGSLDGHSIQGADWGITYLPALVSLVVLCQNLYGRFRSALYTYFILYPLAVCIIYLYRIDAGIELTFILCGILSVFFLRDTGQIIFATSLSMASYFILFLVRKQAGYPPLPVDRLVYTLNQVCTIVYLFYALFLIVMKMNGGTTVCWI
jgi:two-component system sensor histidine kinase/response regulator